METNHLTEAQKLKLFSELSAQRREAIKQHDSELVAELSPMVRQLKHDILD
jgi:hypothetical protein